MSNLYVTEPETNAKVIVETTAGEIEVELWGKECPKAVRNFLALAMEGYYDGVIFHRIVPGFIVQTGDPTGTGLGGESFYGEPFQDEKHGRLRFNRRGLVGMANSGKRNTNTSQFFFTLDKAEELTNNHTMFGKVMGNTLYNVMDIGQLDIDANEKPLNPPKIKTIRIIENPFDDIVPRITAAEKKAQLQARLEAKQESDKRERRSKAKKNTALLSFGEAEEAPEGAEAETAKEKARVKRKGLTRQDLVEDEPAGESSKRSETFVGVAPSLKDLGKDKEKKEKKAVDLKEIRAKHLKEQGGDSESRQAEIKRMQDDLRKLKKAAGNDSDSESDSSETRRKRRKGPSYLEQELAKYSKGRGRAAASRGGGKRGKRDEEDELLAELGAFSKRVVADQADEGEERDADLGENGEVGGGGEEGLEVDDDVAWMRHRLKFQVDEKELTRRAEEEYSVIDPRAKARQLADEGKREKDSQRKGRTAGDIGRR